MSSFKKWIVIAIVLGIALYASVYFYGAHSDAYKFAQTWLRESEPLKSSIGEIKETHLSLWGGYSEHIAGDERNARLVVEVTGTKRTVDVKLALRKDGATWRVVQSGVLE